ncbi:STAS domain-containing protein [Thiomicrorhabdus sp.]|uniref:STAS domain-containing protein n=1 Tax=Thiomicrorhabdus sp. TaxID=2039724 RepID=UPI0035622733
MADTITLPESLTIHTIDNIYTELRESLSNSGDEVVINAEAVETIDTSGLQALLILVNTAQQENKSITWQNASELLSQSAEKLGLSEALKLA